MARKPRIHVPGGLYHVMLRGNGGMEIFYDDADRYHFYQLLQEGVVRYGHRIHGFCLMKCIRLRILDLDFEYQQIIIRNGKGQKDRVVPLPKKLKSTLANHFEKRKIQHENDLSINSDGVYLLNALSRKYPNAAKEWKWVAPFHP